MEWPQRFTLIKSMFNEMEMLRGIAYSKLQFRSGNNDIIKLITNNLIEILLEDSLVIKTSTGHSNMDKVKIEWNREKAHELREVFLFLMLNTNINYRRNLLKCNPNLEHLYKIFDLLPPFLFMEIIWICQLDKMFMEMLSYAPAWLSHPYYEEAHRSLSFISDPFEVLNKIQSIYEAIIVSIAMSRGKGQDSLHEVMLCDTMPTYVDKLLLHFVKGCESSAKFKGAKLKRFKGRLTLNLLEMSATSIKVYKQKLIIPAECSIYRTFIKKKVACQSEMRNDLIKRLFAKVLNALQSVLTSIDIATFMEWTEIETEGGFDNLQQRIGALTYTLNEHLNHKSALIKHDLTRELIVFMIQPKPFVQRVKEANIGKLLNMLDDKTLMPHQIKDCFDEIFRRPIIYGSDECINILIAHSGILKLSHCKRIIGFIIVDLKRSHFEYMETEGTDDYEEDKYINLIKLLYHVYKKLSLNEKGEFLVFRHKHFISYSEVDFKLTDYQRRYHAFWNQLSDTNADYDEFLNLCFESEDGMWNQLFDHILSSNKFLDFAWHLTDHYAHFRLPIIMKKTLIMNEKLTEKFYCNVFVYNFLKMQLATRKDIEDELLKVMLKSAKKQKYNMTYEYVKILSAISEQEMSVTPVALPFYENTANILARVGYVMDKSLWKIRTFSFSRARLVNECQKFLENNARDFVKKADAGITNEVSKFIGTLPYARQVMYYMRVLFIQDRLVPYIVFMEVCFKKKEKVEQRNRMIATILMRSTQSEFDDYANTSYVTPQILHSVMREMMAISVKVDTKSAYNNYYYMYNAYMNFLINALNSNDDDFDDDSKWHYDDLLEHIIQMINASKPMHKRLLLDSADFFIAWIKKNKNIGKDIINRIKQMSTSTKQLEVLHKLNSIMTSSSLPSPSLMAASSSLMAASSSSLAASSSSSASSSSNTN